MIYCRLILAIASLLLGVTASPAIGQAGGDQLAAELNLLRQQQRQVERNISQYETSIELLGASSQDQATPNAALRTLAKQLQSSRRQLLDITERESQLMAQLMPAGEKAARNSVTEEDNPDAADVARLRTLLRNYYAEEARTEAAAIAGTAPAQEDIDTGGSDFSLSKIRLSGPESVAALENISRRLADNSMPIQRRELDIIFHVEVRRDGKLISSSSHSLKALGKSQYIGKVSLQGGSATFTVRKEDWSAKLITQDSSDYLITLSQLRGADSELHVIPVDELKATQWAELPPWLPYIGPMPTRS